MRHKIVGFVFFCGNYCSTSICQISSRFWRFHRRNFQFWQICFRFCLDERNGRSSQQRITWRYVLISSRFSRTSSRTGGRSFRKVVERERDVALTDKAPAVHLEEGDGGGGQGQTQVQQLAKLKMKKVNVNNRTTFNPLCTMSEFYLTMFWKELFINYVTQ